MRHFVLIALVFLLAACTSDFKTDYGQGICRAATAQWGLRDVRVNVSRDLVVSESNSFNPGGDIVWQEEPRGDRYIQVARIFEEAANAGGAALDGARPVIIEIDVLRFHSLSKRARYGLTSSGVHNIHFKLRAVDALTGQVLAQNNSVRADLAAFVGAQAVEMETKGITQRVRIVHHLKNVVAGWLGTGKDVNAAFSRLGA